MIAVGVILAAGASRRMGLPKALLQGSSGQSFLSLVTDALKKGGCSTVLAVVPDLEGDVAHHATGLGLNIVLNPEGGGGQLDSLLKAVQEVKDSEPAPQVLLWIPVDVPFVTAGVVRDVLQAVADPETPIAVPSPSTAESGAHEPGSRGHPVAVRWEIVEELQTPGLPEGARSVIRKDSTRVAAVPVGNPRALVDVDTPDTYIRLFGVPPKTV